MEKKITILLTFDYELPLGGCKSYEKGLFEPTNKILEIGKTFDVPMVFFADICSYIKFEEWGVKDYYEPFKEQLQFVLKENHDAQLHIHPHWFNSKFQNDKFIPSKNYTLNHFKDGIFPFNIEGIINQSTNKMYEILSPIDENYKCIAYRGGGYNLSPSTESIIQALYKNGIRIDSTMLKYYYYKSELKFDDYRKLPNLNTWKIDHHGNMVTNSSEGVWEIPVTTMPINSIERVKRISKKIKHAKKYKKLVYDHTGTGLSGSTKKLKDKILNFIYSPLVLSFDNHTTDINILEKILSYTTKRHKNQKEYYICVNSHPKGFGKHQNDLMCQFIEKMRNKSNVRFSTFQQLYTEKLTSND